MTKYTKPKLTDKRNDHHINTPTQVLLIGFSLVGAYLYGKFLLDPANAGDILPYTLAVLAESFILFQAIVTVWTIVVGGYNPRNFDYHRVQSTLLPLAYRQQLLDTTLRQKLPDPNTVPFYLNGQRTRIAVFITVYGEPVSTVRQTASAAKAMLGQHDTYILDDGDSDAIKLLAKEIGVGYIRRKRHNNAKAGNINNALAQTQSEYFVIFDADFVPMSHFLHETLPFFNDPSVAFVQTPQVYRNFDTIISRGAGYMQSLFYKLVMPGKNRFNAAFCVGTNVIFRRSAINAIGGMYTGSNSEDIWTALKLHERGYRSIYIPDELAIGETPDTIKAYTKQQVRWATGGMEIFLRHNPLFIKGLSLDQKIQYFATTSYYMLGLATALLMLLPPLQIFFGWSPVNLHIAFATWLMFYLSFYGTQIINAFYSMNGFRPEVLLLATVSFPMYLRAFWNALRGKEVKWTATGSQTIDSPYNYTVPHILLFVFLFFTTCMGIYDYVTENGTSLSLVWNTINLVVFGSYLAIAHKESMNLKKIRKQVTKQKRHGLKLALGRTT